MKQALLFTIFYLMGFWICSYLQTYFGFTSTQSAAICGLTFSAILMKTSIHELQSAVYAGAFGAMGITPMMFQAHTSLALALIAFLLFIIFKRLMPNFGGTMGTISFLSSFIVWAASRW